MQWSALLLQTPYSCYRLTPIETTNVLLKKATSLFRMSLPVSVAFRYVTGSAACYSLSQELQLIPAVSTFKQHLKTELFRQSYASI